MVLPALAGIAIGGGLLSSLGGLFGHSGPGRLERENTYNLEKLAGAQFRDQSNLRRQIEQGPQASIARGLMSQQMYANNRNLLGAASQMGGTGANQQLAIRNALQSGAQADAGAAGQMAAMGMQEELMKRQMLAAMQGQLAGQYNNLVGIGAGRTAAKNQATQQAFGGLSQGLLGMGTSMLGGGLGKVGGGGGGAAPAQAAMNQAPAFNPYMQDPYQFIDTTFGTAQAGAGPGQYLR